MKRAALLFIALGSFSLWPQTTPTFVVLPFRDESGFEGKHWDIQQNLPRVLADSLHAVPGYGVVPFDEVLQALDGSSRRWQPGSLPSEVRQLAQRFGARYAVVGTIQEFSISRFNVGSPMLGGYGAYRVKIRVRYSIVDLDSHSTVAARTTVADVKNRRLGLTLLGKPAKEEIDYAALDRLEFDSEEFRQTLVGRAVHDLKAEFIGQLRTVLPVSGQTETDVTFREATVLLVREGELYIAAGSADGIQPGDEFDVFTDGEELRDPVTNELLGYADKRIGKIRVEVVRDQHLSLARILEGAGVIRARDRVRISARPKAR
jgi:hypothetical protein